MSDTLLLAQPENGISVVTFNRPETRNALDLATMQQFAAMIAELGRDANLHVVILTGAGEDAFCSGGDLSQLSTMPSADEARTMITLMGDALLALERLSVPVIAAVNGYALGGGSEIALACDLRIVDEKARVGLVQIRMGLTPGWGAGQRLLRLVGYARAMEILLRGQVMYAQEIEALGLANRVVEKGKALEYALTLAREIASQPPNVVRSVKTLLQAGLNSPYEEALHIEREQFPPLWAADAHLRAVEAFLGKQLKHEQK